MNGLAAEVEQPSDRVLREPVDLQIGDDLAQFFSNSDIPTGMAKPETLKLRPFPPF